MRSAARQLALGALPAVAAGFLVLVIAGVGAPLLMVQGASVALAGALATAMSLARGRPRRTAVALWACGGVLLCAAPLVGDGRAPERWIRLGALSLYIAPVVLPALIAAAAHASRWSERRASASVGLLGVLALVLAIQPDLSQVLALAAGATVIIAVRGRTWSRRATMCLPFLASIAIAAAQPDPLAPVPHVEQVIALSWAHSIPSGIAVSAAAVFLVATTARTLARIDRSMMAVAAYYALLFACSIRSLTPAPLIGYGAGPLLGFGLLVGTVSRLGAPPARAPGAA